MEENSVLHIIRKSAIEREAFYACVRNKFSPEDLVVKREELRRDAVISMRNILEAALLDGVEDINAFTKDMLGESNFSDLTEIIRQEASFLRSSQALSRRRSTSRMFM